MADFWLHFGITLGAELVFAIGVAWLTRLISKYFEDQTFWLVVLGVAGVLAIAGWLIGWMNVLILFAAFAVAGIPMAIEFFGRMIRMQRASRQAEKEMLDGHSGADR